MAYERGGHWYKSRREGGRVVTEYIGTGELGRLCAEADNMKQRQRVQERAQRLELAAQERAAGQSLDTIAAQLKVFTDNALTVSGYHKHSGTWRRARA